jgi:dipeptidyl-peptidase 4
MAMASFNDTQVDEFTYYLYGEPGNMDNQYPEDVKIRYPKVWNGSPFNNNSKV